MGRAVTGSRSTGCRRGAGSASRHRPSEDRDPGVRATAGAVGGATRARRARPRAARRPRARLPVPERARRRPARARRRRPGVCPGRRRRLRHHRSRPRARARRRGRGAPSPRLRSMHARGGRAARVDGSLALRPRGPARSDGLPAPRRAAAHRARSVRRAGRDHGRRRGRPSPRARGCDRRPGLQRQHATHQRPPLGRRALLVGGGARREAGWRQPGAGTGASPAQRRRRARDALPDAERAGGRGRRDRRARARIARAERHAARRAGHGRGARPRAGARRVAPPARARGRGRLLDLAAARRTHARMSEVARILDDGRERGDAALRKWALELDGVEPQLAEPDAEVPTQAIKTLAAAVRRWHALQRPADVQLEIAPGVELTRRWHPLASVGIYVPRGLVSTLVMCAVPAQVAGVERIVVATPPSGAGAVAAAARLLGLEEVWALGGPPAIAAFSFGTESFPRVDKIIGPGNAYVNEAKLLVSREVAIDLPAGPSEIVVLAGA